MDGDDDDSGDDVEASFARRVEAASSFLPVPPSG